MRLLRLAILSVSIALYSVSSTDISDMKVNNIVANDVKDPFDLKNYKSYWKSGSMNDILVLALANALTDHQMELYHTKDDNWESKLVERTNTSSYRAAFVNDRLIIAGGRHANGTSTNEAFEIITETGKVIPLSPMNEVRRNLGLVTVGEGESARLYAVGGYSNSSSERLNSIERWNPFNDTWRFVSPMNVARESMALVEHEGNIYVFGGSDFSALDITEVYLIDEDRWEFRTSMIHKTYFCNAVSDGKYIYVVGGANGTFLNHVQRYDVGTDSWKLLASTTASSLMGISLLNNAPIVFGGYIPDTGLTNVVETYDAEYDVWHRLTPMYISREIVAALQVP